MPAQSEHRYNPEGAAAWLVLAIVFFIGAVLGAAVAFKVLHR